MNPNNIYIIYIKDLISINGGAKLKFHYFESFIMNLYNIYIK